MLGYGVRAIGEEVPAGQKLEELVDLRRLYRRRFQYLRHRLLYPRELRRVVLGLECPSFQHGQGLEVQLLKERSLPLRPYIRAHRPHIGEGQQVQKVQPPYVGYLAGELYDQLLIMHIPVLGGVRQQKVVFNKEFHKVCVVLAEVKPPAYLREHIGALVGVVLAAGFSYVVEEHGEHNNSGVREFLEDGRMYREIGLVLAPEPFKLPYGEDRMGVHSVYVVEVVLNAAADVRELRDVFVEKLEPVHLAQGIKDIPAPEYL